MRPRFLLDANCFLTSSCGQRGPQQQQTLPLISRSRSFAIRSSMPASACMRNATDPPLASTRRRFLESATWGFSTLALASLLDADRATANAAELAPGGRDLAPRPPHFSAPARSVIMLMQVGGPSHVDLF